MDEDWHVPFHLVGAGPNPSSVKLSDSGQIPVSNMPMITLLSYDALFAVEGKPMKSHERVL